MIRDSNHGDPRGATLLIVSHTPHHHRDGQVVGWGPTVAEIDELAGLFARVRHLAPLHPGPAPRAANPYRAGNVEVVPIAPAGGDTLRAKIGILAQAPGWIRLIRREQRRADVTHIRAPANIALVALLCRRGPTWIKYAGDWRARGGPWSYRAQRALARAARRSVAVTVNGSLPGDPATVRSFDNPSLAPVDVENGARAAATTTLAEPLRLVFAGRVEAAKGPLIAIDAVAALRRSGHDAHLIVVGDGPQLSECRERGAELDLDDAVVFPGSLPRDDLLDHLGSAQFVVLPTSASEGWPKVLSEGMAFGAVPVTTSVSSIGEVLGDIGCGTVTAPDPEAIAAAVEAYLVEPRRWADQRDRGVAAAHRFTFATHVQRVRDVLTSIAPDLPLPATGGAVDEPS